jgi:hypothetical protein
MNTKTPIPYIFQKIMKDLLDYISAEIIKMISSSMTLGSVTSLIEILKGVLYPPLSRME